MMFACAVDWAAVTIIAVFAMLFVWSWAIGRML